METLFPGVQTNAWYPYIKSKFQCKNVGYEESYYLMLKLISVKEQGLVKTADQAAEVLKSIFTEHGWRNITGYRTLLERVISRFLWKNNSRTCLGSCLNVSKQVYVLILQNSFIYLFCYNSEIPTKRKRGNNWEEGLSNFSRVNVINKPCKDVLCYKASVYVYCKRKK